MEKKSFKKYIILFPVLAAVVIFVVLKGTDIQSVLEAMRQADHKWLLVGILLAAAFNVAEGVNLMHVLQSFGYKISFTQGMKYAYIGYFFSSITPSATGGQPLQLYAMNKDDIHVAHGTLAILVEVTSFQLATFVLENIAAAGVLLGKIHLSRMMLILGALGYVMNFIFIAALMVVILSEKLKEKIVGVIQWLLRRLPIKNKENACGKLNGVLHDFEDCKSFLKKDPGLAGRVIVISFIQVICWFSVPWAVYHAMGESGSSYIVIFLHQIILYMTTALLPFPGAEGISEFSFVKLFAKIFETTPVAAVVLVNRGISFYFLLVLSGILGVLLGRGKKHSGKAMEMYSEKC